MSTTAGTEPGCNQELGNQSRFSRWVAGLSYLCHHLLLPRVHSSRWLSAGVDLGALTYASVPPTALTTMLDAYPDLNLLFESQS